MRGQLNATRESINLQNGSHFTVLVRDAAVAEYHYLVHNVFLINFPRGKYWKLIFRHFRLLLNFYSHFWNPCNELLFLFHVQFCVKICLLTSFRDTCFVEIVPQQQTTNKGKTKARA